MDGKHAQMIIVTLWLLLVAWAGDSIISNGKAIARVETQVVYITKQLDKIINRESLTYNFTKENE